MVRMFESGYDDGIDFDPAKDSKRSARADAIFANDRKGKNTADFPETNNDESSMIAQLLTHEMVKTKKAQMSPHKAEGGFNCCNPHKDPFVQNLISLNKYCHPIDVDSSDKCFGGKVGCLNYIKSLHSMQPGCPLSEPSTPTNFETPYLDAQLIYNDLALKHLEHNEGTFDLNDFEAIKSFIVDYDERSMQLPPLFQYLHYFVIVHNRIFDALSNANADLSHTRLSFETRKIVTALYQKIYLDFVKNILREFIKLQLHDDAKFTKHFSFANSQQPEACDREAPQRFMLRRNDQPASCNRVQHLSQKLPLLSSR